MGDQSMLDSSIDEPALSTYNGQVLLPLGSLIFSSCLEEPSWTGLEGLLSLGLLSNRKQIPDFFVVL